MPLTVEPRPFNLKKTVIVGSLVLAAIAATYLMPRPGPAHPYWQGETMGTTYTIRIANSPLREKKLQRTVEAVQALLDEFNRQMSTYLPDSEISRFNQLHSIEPMQVSELFARTTARALLLASQMDGAFDPTIFPLLQAWGFGPSPSEQQPSPETIDAAKANTGYGLVEALQGNRIKKKKPVVQLDLNALAKGLASDKVAELLNQEGAENVFVEIGGEIRCTGTNMHGTPWRIGIDQPVDGAAQGESIAMVIELSGQGIATSGDYRNFKFDEKGERISHIIDPRSGTPIAHDLASVTVIAPSCEDADAMATGLFVMGREDGLAWVEQRSGVEALFITRTHTGTFETAMSSGFSQFVGEPPPESP